VRFEIRSPQGSTRPISPTDTFCNKQRNTTYTNERDFQMIQVLISVVTKLGILAREEGQDAFEYALVVGGISVVVVGAMAAIALGAPSVVSGTCAAIATLLPGVAC
jgi:Flp pilus assembly pilin Flp